MKDNDRFVVTYYNRETLERDSNGVLGLDDKRFFKRNFIPLTLDDGLVNPEFLDFAFNVQWFRVESDRGSCAFRCENRATKNGTKQYWYAYKKLDGKTNRFNIGDLSKLSFETIEEAIAVVCGLKVAQKKSATKKQVAAVGLSQDFKVGDRLTYRAPELPYQFNRGQGVMVEEYEDNIYVDWQDDKHCPHLKTHALKELVKVDDLVGLPMELAGHGKNTNHLQPDLINCHEQLAIAKSEIESQHKYILELLDDVKQANRKEHEQWKEVQKLKAVIKKHDDNATELAECKQLLIIRGQELNDTVAELESAYSMNDHLSRNIDSLQDELRKTERENQELNERGLGLKELHHEALQRIYQLECEASKREDDVQGYAYMYEEHSNRIFAYQSLIEQYRSYAYGKTKKAHPRYAYLIDLLADIDKVC